MRPVARRSPRWAAVAALAVLLGLVGMHGLPMTMGPSTAAMTMTMASGSAMPHTPTAHPTSAAVNGCGLDHGGCVTTLRDPDHLPPTPAAVVTTALERDTPVTGTPIRTTRSDRAPPDRPDLTELCISRT